MYRLLQLSDLHFGEDHAFSQRGEPPGRRPLSEAVIRSLAEAGIDPSFDALILCGDVFDKVTVEERRAARAELRRLIDALPGLGRAIIVPGNHDLSWDPAFHGQPREERFAAYNSLVAEFPEIEPPLSELPAVTVLSKDGLKPLALLLLDSCVLESPSQAGLGYVGDDKLDVLRDRVTATGIAAESHTVVGVLHHHLISVSTVPQLPRTRHPDTEDRVPVGLTVDAGAVMRELSRHGTRLVLHGHQHTPALVTVLDRRWLGGKRLHIAACGSCGYSGAEMQRQFFVWDIDDSAARSTSLRQTVADPYFFEIDVDNSAALELDP